MQNRSKRKPLSTLNRPYPHSSQAHARKHESEARVDKTNMVDIANTLIADDSFCSSPDGRSKYCCVPGCDNAFYDNQGHKTGISFFSFPLDVKIKNRWLLAIKRQEHRDGFVVTAYTKICERHFRPEEIKKHLSGRKDLKDKTTIPSKFSWNTSSTAFVRKSPKKRCLEVSFEQNENVKCEQGQENSSVVKPDTQICKECVHLRKVVEKLNSRVCTLIKEKSDTEKENSELKDDIEKLKKTAV